MGHSGGAVGSTCCLMCQLPVVSFPPAMWCGQGLLYIHWLRVRLMDLLKTASSVCNGSSLPLGQEVPPFLTVAFLTGRAR